METCIRIDTKIQTKPRPRARIYGKFANIYTPKEAKKYEKFIAGQYQLLNGENFKDKAVFVMITFYFKAPSNFPKWKQGAIKTYNLENYIPCTIHKDLDNLAKSILDSLNGVAFNDDRQVIKLNTNKYGTTGKEHIIIRIWDLQTKQEKQIKEEYKQWKKLGK